MVLCYWTQVNHLAFLHPIHSMFIQQSLQPRLNWGNSVFCLRVFLSCVVSFFIHRNTTVTATLYFQCKGVGFSSHLPVLQDPSWGSNNLTQF